MGLKGTRTEKNILTAFSGESQARNRYTYFSSVARKEGFRQIAEVFEETANQEREHAKRLFKLLEGGEVEIVGSFPAGTIGSTSDNLAASAGGEHHEWSEMYPGFAKVAREEGRFVTEDFDERKFKAYSVPKKCWIMMANTNWDDRNFRKDILMENDPHVFREFRTKVWPRIVTHCGTAQCHGAVKGQGHFKLLNYPLKNERIDYANFLILSRFRRKEWRMIDRSHPEDSLLLTCGMRPEDVRPMLKHPKKDIPVAYTRTDTPVYRLVYDWILSLTPPPEGGRYGVDYKPPFGPEGGEPEEGPPGEQPKNPEQPGIPGPDASRKPGPDS